MVLVDSERNQEGLRNNGRFERIAAWFTGAATSIAVGVGYIASHSAEGNDIVLSTDVAGRTFGFDVSEVLVGGGALIAATFCISALSEAIKSPREDN